MVGGRLLLGKERVAVTRSRVGGRGTWFVLLAAAVALLWSGPLAAAPTDPSDVETDPSVARRRALVLDGEADALRVPSQPELVPAEAFTLELWLKRDPADGCGTLVGKDRAQSYWLAVCNGRLRFSFDGGPTVDGNTVLPERRWAHVAVVFDGTALTFYADGAPDRSVPAGGAALGPSDAPLVIGADARPGLPFFGLVDEVRLWRVARQGREIRDDRFRRPGVQPGLVAAWSLDGTGRDLIGGHDGEIVSGGAYSFDGVLPRHVSVPLSEATIAVDGACSPAEYGLAARVVLDGTAGGTARVLATAQDLFVCVPDLDRPANQNAIVGVFLDRDLSRRDPAQPGDHRFGINYRGIARVDEGDGVGGYREVTLTPDAWAAARTTERDTWSAEIRISRANLPSPEPDRPLAVGLAIAHADVARQGDDYLWPVGAATGAPSTWSESTFADSVGLPPAVRFSGHVRRPIGADETEGVAGAEVLLYALQDEDLSLVDRTVSDGGGAYALGFRGVPPEAFLLRELDPRGMSSVSADAGLGGEAVAPNALRYDAGDDGRFPAELPDGLFVDRIGPSPTEPLDGHYLIVYAPPVTEADLWPLAEAKRRQGFRVVTASTDDIWRQADGRDLAARVHRWLRSYWEGVEPEPVYALLVGRGDAVPYRDVAWLDNDHRDPAAPTYYPAWPTTWYYADVDSDWDADGDGFFGEFMACAPDATFPDPEVGVRDCPEAGSLSREGPYGALRSPDDDFLAEILVGRIAANTPGDVRSALAASIEAEAGAAADKRRALLAGSFWWYEGDTWSEEAGRSVPGGSPDANPWILRPWRSSRPHGLDAAEHLDVTLRALIGPFTSEITRLYESTSPDGDPELAPTRRDPDAPLAQATFAARWRDGRYGIVNVEGNGSAEGVTGARWQHDWDGDRRIDQPARPDACRGDVIDPLPQVGPPCWELIPETFLSAQVPEPAGPPPVVFANAARTAAVAWTWDGMDERGNVANLRTGPVAVAGLVGSRGRASAWVGALGAVRPGMLDEAQDVFNTALLGTSQRLGDALWTANNRLARSAPFDPRAFQLGLFGDPAMLYWGGALDTAAIWPQPGGDWRNTGASAWSGPAVAAPDWQVREAGGVSPVAVGADGSLYAVVGTTRVARLSPGGDIVAEARLPSALSQPHPHGPVLSSGGLLLAVDEPPALLRYDRDLNLEQQIVLRSGAPVGPVRVGPDGTAWVPTAGGMERVTGPGQALSTSGGRPTGGVAWLPDGDVVWSVEGATVLRYDRDDGEIERIGLPDSGTLTEPAVTAQGSVVVGSSSGRLHVVPEDGERWRVDTGREIRARPVVSAGGDAIVVNQAGDVIAYDTMRRAERWRHRLDMPAPGAPAVDGGTVYVPGGGVSALDLGSGRMLWRTDDVTAVHLVIGAGRALYASSALGLAALREAGWLVGPSRVTAVATTGRVTVGWRDNDDAETGYRIELCDVDDRCRRVGEVAAGRTSFVAGDLPVAPGEPLYARVQALAGGNGTSGAARASDYARSGTVVAVAPPPNAPRGLVAEALSADAIRLSWSPSGDTGLLEGYVVQRALRVIGPFEDVGYVASDQSRFQDEGLVAGQTYVYRVVALAGGASAESDAATVRTKEIRLAAPTEARSAVGRRAITVRWRDNERLETGYVVQRRPPGSAAFETIGVLGPNATAFEDGVYLADGVYHYRIQAVADEVVSPFAQVTVRYGGSAPSAVLLPFVVR